MRYKFKTQEELVNHLKSVGFVFANSEIYNGLANAWDYGPLGVLLKNNLKNLWWKEFVTRQKNIVGLDSAIILNPLVWKASGHLDNFSDPLIDCKNCKTRYRADKLIESFNKNIHIAENSTNEEFMKVLNDHKIFCPTCKQFNWTDIRHFNLMFKTHQGVIEDPKNIVYLRPETAQGIFVNFKNVQRSMRLHLPFGIAQIGKSFRNEITPGNFIFRTREFEQMEIEFFLKEETAYDVFDKYLNKIQNWLVTCCGLDLNNLRKHEHPREELSHYSKKTIDFEYNFLHGFSELYGIAYRTNYDLSVHMNLSKKDLTYFDEETKQKYIPHVIEPSVGVERLLYAILTEATFIEKLANDEERILMNLKYDLAPYKIAVMPLVNKLKEKAEAVYNKILDLNVSVTFDNSGSIGKRYRRQDAIGTIYCITIDYDSFGDEHDPTFTIRERNTMAQKRIKLSELSLYLSQKAHENFQKQCQK
ncbi:MAG: glycine--tRNA ligase [Ureaplasma parvum]|uniref:glycine--tRNA ligase n=1 Tax=Ureaplasma parvum TaxID=134821 RepID=UPI0029104AFA|nr:glycine--tRNA ligase [Ureaplasma parvum]MDU7891560.1 glycine--tRNA ligase [Ureaplasma parvum]